MVVVHPLTEMVGHVVATWVITSVFKIDNSQVLLAVFEAKQVTVLCLTTRGMSFLCRGRMYTSMNKTTHVIVGEYNRAVNGSEEGSAALDGALERMINTKLKSSVPLINVVPRDELGGRRGRVATHDGVQLGHATGDLLRYRWDRQIVMAQRCGGQVLFKATVTKDTEQTWADVELR